MTQASRTPRRKPAARKKPASKPAQEARRAGTPAVRATKAIRVKGFPAVEVKRSEIHGRGLFAAEDIPRGTLIGRYEGPRARRDGAYVLWVHDGDEVYGVNGKNHLRFVNHSAKPSAYFDAEDLYAKRRIRAGEEITFHYGEDWA